MQLNNKYAFFDFDETIVSIKSMFSFKKALMLAQGYPAHYFDMFMDQVSQKSSIYSRNDMNRWFYSTLEGIDTEFADDVVKKWSDSLIGYVFIDRTFNLIKQLQKDGYSIVVVSGSARFIIIEFLRKINVSHTLCSEPEKKRQIFTGRLVGEPVIGKQKQLVVKNFLNQLNVTTAQTIAVGDHISDLPMLEYARQAMVVNPDKELRSIAHQKGWLEI